MKNKSLFWIIVAFVFSIALGLFLQPYPDCAEYFEPLGKIYINLIKFVMIPLVFSSLVVGVSDVTDVRKMGKIGLLTIVFFIITTLAAITIGVSISSIYALGTNEDVLNNEYIVSNELNITDVLINIFPDNFLGALVNTNMMQTIFAAVLIGVCLSKMGAKGSYVYNFINEVSDLSNMIIGGVMKLTPIGIVGLLVPTIIQNGYDVLLPLIKVVGTFYLGVVIHIVITYGLLIRYVSDFKVIDFVKMIIPVQLLAFVSCSSMATLPVSLKTAQEKMNISKEVSGFILPLGATINMDGNALYQGIVTLFIAESYGVSLTLLQKILVVLIGTIASIGAAGVPGAGMVVLSTVLVAIGMPIDGIALVAGIDRIFDMGRTMMNVTGDIVTTSVVDKIIRKIEKS